jgi:O-antigen/teichoic acid export membrane protein
MDSLRSIRGFATAMGLNSVIGILMTNMDKIVLSKLLPLETFAYYAIATSAAAGLWSIVIPYNAAVFPRLTQVWEQGAGTATADFRRLYHGVAQGASLLLLPTALTLITFAPVVLMVWQNDVDIVANAWLPMALLAAGNLLNGLSGPGHNLLLAAGRAGILTAVNGLMALALIPFMALAISWIGPMAGASLTWLLLNALYFVAVSPLAHRLLLPGTSLRWLLGDVAPPAVACAVVLVPSYLFIAMPTGRLTALLMVAVIGCATLLAAALATPVSRHRLLASLGLRAQG